MIGRTLSHYEILEEISRGGMGVVYRARDIKLKREVALKVLPPDLVSDHESRVRFEQEALLTAALEHPHIAVVYEVDEVDGVDFLAMELIRGKTLTEILFEGGPLPLTRALDLAIEAGEGLAAAHEKGIVHRDLKPGNMMITDAGHVKIIDFGLGKLREVAEVSEDEYERETAPRRLTEPGTVVGTTHYMAPEQARGVEADARSDVFSLGVVLYEMLTGKTPFSGRNSIEILSAILKDDPAPLEPVLGGDPAVTELQRVVDKCLAKDPLERYQSVSDLVVDLKRIRRLSETGLPAIGVATAKSLTTPKTRKIKALAVLVGLALAAVFAGVLGSRRDDATRETASELPAVSEPLLAVMSFVNLSRDPESAWLSTAFSEMFETELSTGGGVRTISGEDVARMTIELDLVEARTITNEMLSRIRDNLNTDYVVIGSYTALGGDDDVKIRLDVRLRDATRGETIASIAETGTEAELFDLVTRAGEKLRGHLGVGKLSAAEISAVRASTSSSTEAARYYAEGLAKLRAYEAAEARELLERAVEIDADFALAHSALGEAWLSLGYDRNALASAERAYELSEGLPRDDELLIEGRYHVAAAEWDDAVNTYRVLWSLHPNDVSYGLKLAETQALAGRGEAVAATVAELRELSSPGNDDPRVDLMDARGAELRADYRQSLERARAAEQKARAQGAWILLAESLSLQGEALLRLGHFEESTAALGEARALFEDAGNAKQVGGTLNFIAIGQKYQGKLSLAVETYRQALATIEPAGVRNLASSLNNNLAVLTREKGQLAEAESLLRRGAELAHEAGNVALESANLETLASVFSRQGRLDEAEQAARESLRLAEEADARSEAAWARFRLGEVLFDASELVRAKTMLESALSISEATENTHLASYVLLELGRLAIESDQLEEASEVLGRSRAIRADLEERATLAETDLAIASLMLEQRRAGDAERVAAEVGELFARNEMLDVELASKFVLVRALLAQNEGDVARELIGSLEAGAARTENPELRLESNLFVAVLRVDEASADAIRQTVAEADELGLVRLGLEARLALAELELRRGERVSSDRLKTLAEEARAKGLHRIARKSLAHLE